MRVSIPLVALAVLTAPCGHAQGFFNFNNDYARTHIGSIDGPLAGPGIWAQMLAGPSADAVAPVGKPAEHLDIGGTPSGLVFGGAVQVPGVPSGPPAVAYVEMLAWDGARWGTILSGVPKDQLGMTDVVPVVLAGVGPGEPPQDPRFTRSAIVPIPEPSVLGIAIIGGLGALLLRACWQRPGSSSGRLAHRPGR
jgi:hypothetical protein